MPSHSVCCAWHCQSQATCSSNGRMMQLVCLSYCVSLWIWGPWTTKIKFFFLHTPNLADASIIAEQMFSLENLFPISYDEESPSENKQMYICESSSKTKPSISDERQQMACAWGNRYQTGWKSLKDLFPSTILFEFLHCPFLLPVIAIWIINSGFYCLFSPMQFASNWR